jgi:cytochrome c551/c552
MHPDVYYTLNNIPEGRKLSISELSTTNSGKAARSMKKQEAVTKSVDDPSIKAGTTVPGKVLTAAEIKPLMLKYTCASCHNANEKQVGPSFKEIAKRNYSTEKILSLIYNPQKSNWPEFPTEMPPMTQVPKAEARKLANWIRSLR